MKIHTHCSGDEIVYRCLDEVPAVKEWMAAHGMNTSTYDPLVVYYEKKVLSFMEPKKTPIIWQEVFEASLSHESLALPNYTLVGVWKSQGMTNVTREIVTSGFKTIISGNLMTLDM